MKKFLAALAAVTLAAVALTGCSSSGLKFTGDFGGELTFKSGFPVTDTGDKLEVIEQGDKPVEDAPFIVARRTVFNGKTGEKLAVQVAPLPTETVDQDPEWLTQVVSTTGVDQRSVIVAPISDVFGTGVASQVGLEDSSPIVVVDDVLSTAQAKATGKTQNLPAGFPTITLAENGQPTVTLPAGDPPSDLQIADSILGDGKTVKSGDDVVVHYQGTNWRTGEVFDQDWGSRVPQSFNTDAVVSGFKKALVGHKVGSQVVAIIPPAEGYGEAGNEQAKILGTDTLVFVIDILGTLPGLPTK